jgi:hypothetical protein
VPPVSRESEVFVALVSDLVTSQLEARAGELTLPKTKTSENVETVATARNIAFALMNQ